MEAFRDRRVLQAVALTVLFIAGTWLVMKPQSASQGGLKSCPKLGTKMFTDGMPRPWVFMEEALDEGAGNVLPAYTCGEFKTPTGPHNAQEALLANIAEMKVLFDSLRLEYWVDRDNLASALLPGESGEPAGYFHPLDYTLEIGIFSKDIRKIARSVANERGTLKITSNSSVISYSPALPEEELPRDVHIFNSTTGIFLVSAAAVEGGSSFKGTAFKVVDKVTGAAVVVTSYTMSEDGASIEAALRLGAAAADTKTPADHGTTFVNLRSLLPLTKLTVYGVDYPCPAHPRTYLNELAGGSWLQRTSASRAKWLLVVIVFLALAYYVFKRTGEASRVRL